MVAAIAPSLAAVINWRRSLVLTSPATNTFSKLVLVSSLTTKPFSSTRSMLFKYLVSGLNPIAIKSPLTGIFLSLLRITPSKTLSPYIDFISLFKTNSTFSLSLTRAKTVYSALNSSLL